MPEGEIYCVGIDVSVLPFKVGFVTVNDNLLLNVSMLVGYGMGATASSVWYHTELLHRRLSCH